MRPFPLPPQSFYRPSQFARELGVQTRAVLRHCRAKRLPRINGAYVIDRESAESFWQYLQRNSRPRKSKLTLSP